MAVHSIVDGIGHAPEPQGQRRIDHLFDAGQLLFRRLGVVEDLKDAGIDPDIVPVHDERLDLDKEVGPFRLRVGLQMLLHRHPLESPGTRDCLAQPGPIGPGRGKISLSGVAVERRADPH
jgi:hypothetical protein